MRLIKHKSRALHATGAPGTGFDTTVTSLIGKLSAVHMFPFQPRCVLPPAAPDAPCHTHAQLLFWPDVKVRRHEFNNCAEQEVKRGRYIKAPV